MLASLTSAWRREGAFGSPAFAVQLGHGEGIGRFGRQVRPDADLRPGIPSGLLQRDHYLPQRQLLAPLAADHDRLLVDLAAFCGHSQRY